VSVGGGVRIAVNNSNVAGVPGGGGALLSPAQQAAAAAVTTGVEIAIPLSQVGSPAAGTTIKVAGWINGGGSDYLSNQVIGGFTAAQGNLGGNGGGGFIGDLSGIDFTTFAGDQFVSLTVPASLPAAAITIDGIVDAAYGGIRFVQTNETGFGDGTAGGVDCPGGGSEIDGVFATVGSADLGQGTQGYLFIFISGNVECNFNHLSLFIDSGSGAGFNQIPSSPCLPGADGLSKHRLLKFDAGFQATHYISFRNGGGPFGIFADFSQVALGGSGGYIGTAGSGAPGIVGAGSPCPPSDTYASGSELDAVYSRVDRTTNRLYMLVTGNIKENTFLHLFLDSRTGGQNALRDNNPNIGIADGSGGHLGRFGPASPGGPSLTFDAGFEADYWLASHFENSTRQVIDSAVLRTGGKDLVPSTSSSLDYGSFQGAVWPTPISFDGTSATDFNPGFQLQDGFQANIFSTYTAAQSRRIEDAFIASRIDPVNNPSGYNPSPTQAEWNDWLAAHPPVAGLIRGLFNNSNIQGVTDSSGAGGATATAGLEYSFDLTEIGWHGGPIRVAGFLAAAGSTNISNQVIGGSNSLTDLGDPRNVNFATIPGAQYAIVYCPQDYNQNGVVSVQDIFDFLADYFNNNLQADYNVSGSVSVQDIFDFLGGYFSGACQ
jgi:hypothetical protein